MRAAGKSGITTSQTASIEKIGESGDGDSLHNLGLGESMIFDGSGPEAGFGSRATER